MNNPYHAMLAEMAAELDWSQQRLMGNRTATHPLADRARVLLAQPEPEEVPMPLPGDAEGLAEVFWAERKPQPPADGDVAELQRWGVNHGAQPGRPLLSPMEDGYWTPWHIAADLLQSLASPACYVLDPSPKALASLEAARPGEFIPFCEEGK